MAATEVRFYCGVRGTAPVLDWLLDLNGRDHRAYVKCREAIGRLATHGHELRRPHAVSLRGGIYELRVRSSRVNYRMLYLFNGREAAVVVHGLTKAGRIPITDLERALDRKRRFEANPQSHSYGEAFHGEANQENH